MFSKSLYEGQPLSKKTEFNRHWDIWHQRSCFMVVKPVKIPDNLVSDELKEVSVVKIGNILYKGINPI